MNEDKKTSYTAADSIPLKMLLDEDLLSNIINKRTIPPIHIQLIPTNKCNMDCSFCSCSERTKDQELDFMLLKRIVRICKRLGTKAVTITGGGEPLLYLYFNNMIDFLYDLDIKMGLVTNGLVLHKANLETLAKLTWCRISNGDERRFSDKYKENLTTVVKACPNVDWAFSHVVSTTPNLEEITKIVAFANENNFTHVRLVADLFTPENVDMAGIKKHLKDNNIDDSKVIYQNRKEHTAGGDCYIGYLKPLIGADANIYWCCGVQYALPVPHKDLPAELCSGPALEMANYISESNKPLNGHQCVKCYYMNYNTILKALMSDINHKEFV